MHRQTVYIVIPPSPFLLNERVFPFLGPLKVAAVLEEAGVGVEVLDLSGIKNYADVVKEHVEQSPAAHFGLTATTPQFPAAVEISKVIRASNTDARLIIGGTHATQVIAALKKEQKQNRLGRAHHAYTQLDSYFDVIVAGDGEDAIFSAIANNAPKLIDADDRKSEFYLNNERLNKTPFPARHLIDLPSYHYSVDGAPALSL